MPFVGRLPFAWIVLHRCDFILGCPVPVPVTTAECAVAKFIGQAASAILVANIQVVVPARFVWVTRIVLIWTIIPIIAPLPL